MILQVNLCFCKEKAVLVLFPNYQWHGLMTISTEEGASQCLTTAPTASRLFLVFQPKMFDLKNMLTLKMLDPQNC